LVEGVVVSQYRAISSYDVVGRLISKTGVVWRGPWNDGLVLGWDG